MNRVPHGWNEVVEKYGHWTDHNVELGTGFYTLGCNSVSPKLKRVVQTVADHLGKPLDSLRVLDLGCLEGGYAIEFALSGSTVVGVEAKSANIEKARFVQGQLGLERLTLIQGDIRHLSRYDLGTFDAVLCLGVLYHIDEPHFISTLEQISRASERLTIFDTHICPPSWRNCQAKSQALWGQNIIEYDCETTREEMDQELWGSLDNQTSFWPTKPTLINALLSLGYTSISEVIAPYEPGKLLDRVTLVAIKGAVQAIRTVRGHSCASGRLPESESKQRSPELDFFQDLRRRTITKIPRKLRSAVKDGLRTIGLFPSKPRIWERSWKERHVTRD